jgi:hypothetical protein
MYALLILLMLTGPAMASQGTPKHVSLAMVLRNQPTWEQYIPAAPSAPHRMGKPQISPSIRTRPLGADWGQFVPSKEELEEEFKPTSATKQKS